MSEIRGIGMDLCAIERMKKAAQREHFLELCFTPEERRYAASRGGMEAESLAEKFSGERGTDGRNEEG